MRAFFSALFLLVVQERRPKTKVKETRPTKSKIPIASATPLAYNSTYATMADDRIREQIITEFFLKTCQLRRSVNKDNIMHDLLRVVLAKKVDDEIGFNVIPFTTGSSVEFYIEPMLSCVGDVNVMVHESKILAIPAGYPPPTQLPVEFDSRVQVREIVNSKFPGYVYLVSSYSLTECVDDGKYNAEQCKRNNAQYANFSHGPASFHERPSDSFRSIARGLCVRCLMWPPQAADWPTRHRNYGWPDSASVDRVINNGCDVVKVAHHRCRYDELRGICQHRLSFSRAEILLLNSWMPVQQIVYHMLRYFMKNDLANVAGSTRRGTLSNYHIKTLMLWACEMKARSWWTDDLNLIRICVELLHALAAWLTDTRCKHYFINNCNLFDRLENSLYALQVTANWLMSVTRTWFCEWYIDNYIHKCLSRMYECVPHSSRLHAFVHLQNAVSAIVERRRVVSPVMTSFECLKSLWLIMALVSSHSLTVQSCLHWTDQLHVPVPKTDQVVRPYFTAVVFLHVAYKTTQYSLTDEMLDVLAATCLQSNDARRCLNARRSSVLSLSRAAMLMKVVANNTRSTVQLIEIELAKAYLHRALRCKDSDSNSINCLANVYLAILYYTTGQYHTATDHCALVTRSQDNSQCSSHVQGELILAIDDQVDNILGLVVFYHYIRAAALNEEHERPLVSIFTTELFAHYLLVTFLSDRKCQQFPQPSVADEIRRYRNRLCNSPEVFVTDAILFVFANRKRYPPNSDRLLMADRGGTKSLIGLLHQLDTSKLVELLQQSAVEHLTCRELQTPELSLFATVVSPNCKALYAYKCGQYECCLQLSMHSVHKLIIGINDTAFINAAFSPIFFYPELIQLLDDDIASLIGLMTFVDRPQKRNSPLTTMVSGLILSLYLMTQCQIKLRQPLTSLVKTLDYVHFARRRMTENTNRVYPVNQLVLKFVEQKILKYQRY